MPLPISVIIPTLNEAKYLPKLLHSLIQQTQQPAEIIVADAGSTDATLAIAKKYQCRIVPGGLPGVARNNGAKIATQSLLLFLDADVILPRTFLQQTYAEVTQKHLSLASCYVTPLSQELLIHVGVAIQNGYWYVMKDISPRVCGFCMFVRKSIHTRIKGFDETILIGEDSEYMQRASKLSQFHFLTSQKIPVSIRRFTEEGKVRTFLKCIMLEIYSILVGHIRKPIVKYEFGQHYDL